MKKTVSFILVFVFALSLFAGCSGKENPGDGKIKIVTTIFPEYDWVKNITAGADNVDVTFLLDNGVDLHSYQPTADDIVKITDCDVFVYIGGESDEWVDDVLKKAANKNRTDINLLEQLGEDVKEEETVEGMQVEKEAEEEVEENEIEIDEHVWLSLKNASKLCSIISEILGAADKANSAVYNKNSENYISKLNELDKKYQELRKEAKYDTLIFADRYPFRYLLDDYNLKYYAAFSGCSAESEASFETVAFLAGKLDELKPPAVMTIDGSDKKIAKTVVETSKQKNLEILEMDSMQSVKSEEEKTYLGIMESNLEVLTKAIKE